MTTLFPFQPATDTPFQFQPTLDGTVYNVLVKWNMFRQDWYVFVYTLSSELVLCKPMLGSPDNFDISIIAGYFTSTLVYRVSSNQLEVGP